jgi:hypothetical protein
MMALIIKKEKRSTMHQTQADRFLFYSLSSQLLLSRQLSAVSYQWVITNDRVNTPAHGWKPIADSLLRILDLGFLWFLFFIIWFFAASAISCQSANVY